MFPFATHEPGDVPNLARDAATGQVYRGIHQYALASLLNDLAIEDYTDPRFLSDTDAVALGAVPSADSDTIPIGISTADPSNPDKTIEEVIDVRPAFAYENLAIATPLTHDTRMCERLEALFGVADSDGVRTLLTTKSKTADPLFIEHATWLACGDLGIAYTPDREAVNLAVQRQSEQIDEAFIVNAERLSNEIREPLEEHIDRRNDGAFHHQFTHVYDGMSKKERWSFRDLFRGALSPKEFLGKAALLAVLTGSALASFIASPNAHSIAEDAVYEFAQGNCVTSKRVDMLDDSVTIRMHCEDGEFITPDNRVSFVVFEERPDVMFVYLETGHFNMTGLDRALVRYRVDKGALKKGYWTTGDWHARTWGSDLLSWRTDSPIINLLNEIQTGQRLALAVGGESGYIMLDGANEVVGEFKRLVNEVREACMDRYNERGVQPPQFEIER